MIHALDHIVLAAKSLDAAVAGYEVLLGRRADGASFQLANMRLDLRAHDGAAGEGLSALAFAVGDMEKTRRLLQQRALPVAEADASDKSRALHIAPTATHGVAISVLASSPGTAAPRPSPLERAEEAGAVTSLDHVVIRSPNPERAIALYAGRLGLSLRLDRTEPAWGARLIFFRCSDLIVEVAHDLEAGIGDGPDRLWGLSWRVPDIAKAHTRLRAAGVDVSDLRAGRRPHTRVFTARSHTAGVPTLMIGPDQQQIVLPSHPLADTREAGDA
jgi:catechol 2,3-dioxygenase-like lactoylglutathione lyase family enzyme